MCQSPVLVHNPYRYSAAYEYREGQVSPLDRRFVSHKDTIEVPCCKCAECKHSYFTALLQRSQMEALTSYVYFVTLTYDDKHIPSLEFTTDSGTVRLFYSDRSHIQDLIKRLRNEPLFADRDLRYFGVTEYGTARFRPHHHLLFFVAKKIGDSTAVASDIEAFLYEKVQHYYGKNIGTRKRPIYEPYFTFARRYNYATGKEESNYDCRLVRDLRPGRVEGSQNIGHPTAIASVTQYLISYVNKPSACEELLLPWLDKYHPSEDFGLDKMTYRKLYSLLKCRCYYSKHFGFGFTDDGAKVAPCPKTLSATKQKINHETFFAALPDSAQEYQDLYLLPYKSMGKVQPEPLQEYRDKLRELCTSLMNCYKGCPFDDFVDFLPESLYTALRVLLYYDKSFVAYCIRMVGCDQQSYYPSLLPRRPYDASFETSKVYTMIRQFVERGIRNRSPFLCFEYVQDNQVKCVPLCKYYRRYCTTFEDVGRMYDSLGVKDFDEYVSLFESNIDSFRKKQLRQIANRDKHEQTRYQEEEGQFSAQNLLKSKLESIFAPSGRCISQLYS